MKRLKRFHTAWVKTGPKAMSELSPVYPKLRTLVGAACRSLPGQFLTSAPQQDGNLV
jgi:hypothetical protein